ncbi:MAG TPA: DUF2782 domain-containing protein [Gammaproteobacteria bacterium]|nr:DUF2782 domain-containing protein [Gammaproteobacteria bacterium]
MHIKKLIPLLLLAAATGNGRAEKQTIIVPPQPRTSEPQQEQIEPEVVIRQREDKTIEEYRINGQLYMIKVTPRKGPPYYLIDNDGNGTLESMRTGADLEPDIMIPHWVLFRW